MVSGIIREEEKVKKREESGVLESLELILVL